MRQNRPECGMVRKPVCQPFDRSRKIGQHGLRTHPSTPNTAEQHGEQHNADKEQQKNEQEKIRFADPYDGAEEIEAEGRDVETEGALAADPQKGKPEYECGRQPCNKPAAAVKSLWNHYVLTRTSRNRNWPQSGALRAFIMRLLSDMCIDFWAAHRLAAQHAGHRYNTVTLIGKSGSTPPSPFKKGSAMSALSCARTYDLSSIAVRRFRVRAARRSGGKAKPKNLPQTPHVSRAAFINACGNCADRLPRSGFSQDQVEIRTRACPSASHS
jgi:hypothetical protein